MFIIFSNNILDVTTILILSTPHLIHFHGVCLPSTSRILRLRGYSFHFKIHDMDLIGSTLR